VIKYLEPVVPIHDTEQAHGSSQVSVSDSPAKLLREVNLMAVSSSQIVGGVSVPRAARTLSVHCLLGLGASYFHLGDAQVTIKSSSSQGTGVF